MSWFHTCGVSNLSIVDGDGVALFLISETSERAKMLAGPLGTPPLSPFPLFARTRTAMVASTPLR